MVQNCPSPVVTDVCSPSAMSPQRSRRAAGRIKTGFTLLISAKTGIGTCRAAAAALIFSAFPLPGALGLLLFNMSMPVTLYAARDILREGRATAFGLLTLGLFLGMLPAFSGASGSGQDYAMICLISIMLIRVGVGKR